MSPETLTTGLIPWRVGRVDRGTLVSGVCCVPGFAALSSHPQGIYSGGD